MMVAFDLLEGATIVKTGDVSDKLSPEKNDMAPESKEACCGPCLGGLNFNPSCGCSCPSGIGFCCGFPIG